MASRLGELIRSRREDLGIGLRELARRIGKSPTLVVALELSDDPPSVSEDTLRDIATVLGLNGDELVAAAGKTPVDVTPSSGLEVALYRLISQMSAADQEELLHRLEKKKVSTK